MPEENSTERAILAQTQQNQELLREIHKSVEKTRRYFLWTLILSIILFVLPIVGLVFAIPFFLDTYTSALGGDILGF